MRWSVAILVFAVFGLGCGNSHEEENPSASAQIVKGQKCLKGEDPDGRCATYEFNYDVTDCYNQTQQYLDWICDNSYICTSTQCGYWGGPGCTIDVGYALYCIDSGRVYCKCDCFN